MLHRLCKKALSLCLAFMMAAVAFFPTVSVYAASDGSSLYEDVIEVSDTTTVRTRGNFLNYGTVQMTKISPTRVLLTGITAAHVQCDKLGVGLYLERGKDGENYGNYRHWYFWKENDTSFYQNLEVIVPTGYWYRLGGSHVAIKDGNGESVTTLTDGLYM